MDFITAEQFNRSTHKTKDAIKTWWKPAAYDLVESMAHGVRGPIAKIEGSKIQIGNCGYTFYKSEIVPLLTVDQLISFIRGHAQMDIYTVDEIWCVQLLNLEDAANDIDVSCIWETGAKELIDVLFEATEHICNERIFD